ncbi:hypothetical protein [Yersinia intermedia]|uniref:hypothetical protein n=1 Tax=Yersinia intermedia TaxID=631 RepID=UPI00065D6865|nr:hypothetical protein [Yersinia intermedia]CRY83509.1 Uncharacterised protein [Yersinia intermedia]
MKNGKNERSKSTWEESGIPALEYCRLNRAAELLDCKIDDLLHWAEIGAIELCLKFNGFESVIRPPFSYEDNPDQWIKENSGISSIIGISARYIGEYPLSGFKPKVDFNLEAESEDDAYQYHFEYENHPALKKPLVYLVGLWAIFPEFDGHLYSVLSDKNHYAFNAINITLKIADETNKKDMITAHPPTEQAYDENMRLITPVKTLFEITTNDLFITKQQIETIHSRKGGYLPSFISGEVKGVDREQGKEIITDNTRTTAKQSDYIVGLLKSLGFKDTDLTGSISELRAKIARQSKNNLLPDVDDNTLISWLRRGGINR